MAAYDASYGTPAAARQGLLSSLSDKLSGLFHKPVADPYAPPAPPAANNPAPTGQRDAALKKCKKLKSKRKRSACQKQAQKRFGAKSKKKAPARKRGH